MPATTKVPLGPTTLNRKWYLDVNSGTTEAPVWTGCFGMTEFQPSKDLTLQDDSDFDSEGFRSQIGTALAWTATGKFRRGVLTSDNTAYDPGQEFLRLHSDELGVANVIEVRFYEMEENGPRVEAYQGFATVGWGDDGGAMDALSMTTFTLTGRGRRTPIAHPDNVAEVVPTITSLAPSSVAAAGGDLVIITGTNFATATDVQVDAVAVPAADWEIITATKIAFVAPAHAAGAPDVTVVNGAGTSTGTALTYA